MIEVYGDGGRPQIEANGKAIADSQTEAVTVDEILSDGRGAGKPLDPDRHLTEMPRR
jgi:hypothetical protein